MRYKQQLSIHNTGRIVKAFSVESNPRRGEQAWDVRLLLETRTASASCNSSIMIAQVNHP